MNNKKIVIVIPVFNEGSVIADVIKEIRENNYQNIIVIDDGSTDNTFEIEKENINFLRHTINRGKGAATKTGFEAAKVLGADLIVTVDGDGQHIVDDIKKLITPILNDNYDVVLGSRIFTTKTVPFHKIIYNYIGNFLTFIVYGLWVNDSQSGLRAYSKRAINLIDTECDRYEYDSEVIREIKKNKLKFKEIPIEIRYTEYSTAKQNKQGFVNGIKTVIKMITSTIKV